MSNQEANTNTTGGDGTNSSSSELLAFFRDLSHEENTGDGRSYHAAGLILSRHNSKSVSGKDLAVQFVNPFTGEVSCEWRADGEVEIFEVSEWEYKVLKERLDSIS